MVAHNYSLVLEGTDLDGRFYALVCGSCHSLLKGMEWLVLMEKGRAHH